MKIIASNFKTNHTRKSTKEFIENINKFLIDKNIKNDIYIFPPATALDRFETTNNLTIGAQNAFYVKDGSYTGEIGKIHLDEFNIKTILIGHSERRHILGETQKTISLKFNYFKSLGYKIIYCVGEPLEIKNQGLSQTLGYIQKQFEGIDLDYENTIVAYEPVWAIGTGVSSTVEDITQIHKKLSKKLSCPLLYGGSVKASNISEILDITNVDGVLIGTASWLEEDFKDIIDIANSKN
ncbi:MAG: triose-phosphate isomerase [Campylobacteraceae bacterium 4484_166]|nr:MAG: triose-phosphate isomerase [Campylobacteraceae bacterium 4484_166]